MASNTLHLASLPPPFFHPSVLAALQSHFASYGELYSWEELPSFDKIILVYHDDLAALRAKRECDGLLMWGGENGNRNMDTAVSVEEEQTAVEREVRPVDDEIDSFDFNTR